MTTSYDGRYKCFHHKNESILQYYYGIKFQLGLQIKHDNGLFYIMNGIEYKSIFHTNNFNYRCLLLIKKLVYRFHNMK